MLDESFTLLYKEGMEKLLAYLNSLSPPERTSFCGRCETTEGYLRKACSKGEQLGEGLCINIERESNQRLVLEELRPDADWAYVRSTGCACKAA